MTALTNEVDYKHFDFFPENSPTSARRTASSPFAEVLFDRNLDRLSPSGFKSLHGRFRPQTPVQPPFAARISELGIPKKLFGGLSPYEKLGPGCPLDQAFKLLGEGYDGDEGYEPATGAGCPLEDAFPKFFAPPVIAKGTDKGLMLLCAYYFMKYGVDITVSSSYETFQEALKAPLYSPRARAWGIIATNGDNIRSHVTPVICFREKEGDPTQILQLDSIENPVLSVRETLRAMKSENPEVLIYEVRGSRQTDSFGCRNDALVVLKDALRILNEEAFTDLPNYLDLRKDYGPRYSFFIPLAISLTL